MPNIIARMNDQQHLDEFAPKAIIHLSHLKGEEKYQVVIDTLKQYGADPSPTYTGYGLEVYDRMMAGEGNACQIVVDWDSETIKIK